MHAGLDQGGIDGLDQRRVVGLDQRRFGLDQKRIGLNQGGTVSLDQGGFHMMVHGGYADQLTLVMLAACNFVEEMCGAGREVN